MNKMYLGGAEFSFDKKLKSISFEDEQIPEYVTDFRPIRTDSAEATFECEINPYLFAKIAGVDLASKDMISNYTVEFKSPFKVQKRRHKKKRINKKWAKRYGYKTVFKSIKMTDACVVQHESDFEFVGSKIDILGRLI